MLYHNSQRLHSAHMELVFIITTPDKVIGTFWSFVFDIMVRNMNKTWHKQLISNWYKNQRENQTKIVIITIKSTHIFVQ